MSARSLYFKLRDHFKFVNDLKEEQVRILDALLVHKNVFTVLPTGFGKSLIFAVFPLLMDEVRTFSSELLILVID